MKHKMPEISKMKFLLILIVVFLSLGCTSKHIERHHTSYIRRMPQMNRIEPGRQMKRGSFSGAINASYSIDEPGVMYYSDTSVIAKSTFYSPDVTVMTSAEYYLYESRVMISGEGAYSFTDILSVGFSIDVSTGVIGGTPSPEKNRSVHNDIIEGRYI
ncbi:hypothetical protein QA601_15610 [Chitinispirillales bacterium ANBcel5]|uniref:hypothetical protein n=1 Tax=Cellulosispirillum alkaliphilum TaxID=3039283 RepID=UPI002A529906|nr:hypothetical protein [Chitinispirillales bacterium ANBcel5]